MRDGSFFQFCCCPSPVSIGYEEIGASPSAKHIRLFKAHRGGAEDGKSCEREKNSTAGVLFRATIDRQIESFGNAHVGGRW